MNFQSLLARLSDIFGGPWIQLSNRNFFVDPYTEFWNASSVAIGTTAAYNGATMYLSQAGTGGAATVSYSAVNQALAPPWFNTPSRWLYNFNQTTAHTGTVAASTAAGIWQPVEDVRSFSGKSSTYSLSIYNSGSTNFTITNLIQRQYYGTGGSPSAINVIDKAVNWVVKPGWNRLSVRLDWPVANGTLGTNGNHHLQVGIWLPSGVLFNFATSQWQLEQSNPYSSSDINGAGGAPTQCEYRGYGAEMQRMFRYYFTDSFAFTVSWITSGFGISNDFPYKLPVFMRATPACTGTASGGRQLNQWGVAGKSANMAAFWAQQATTGAVGQDYGQIVYNSIIADARF